MAVNRKDVKKAEKLVGQGKLQSALKVYEGILRKDPDDSAMHNVVGDLYVRSGEPKAAVPHFQKSAELLEAQGFRTKAIAVLRKAYRQAPSNSEIVETLASLLKQEGLVADARQILIELAKNRHQVGQHQEARKLYKKVLEIDPNHVQALLKIGEIAAQVGDIDEECDAYCAIAVHLTNSARFEEALELVEQAYPSAPHHKELSKVYADLLRRTGQHEKAFKVLSASEKRHGADIDTVVSLAELSLEKHDLATAQELFNQARGLDGDSERVMLLGSGIATLAGDYDVALGYLQPLIDRILETKKGGPVIRTLEEIVQRHPAHLPTLRKLDTIYAYIEDQTSRANILVHISKAHEKSGDYKLALEAAEEAQKLEPDKLAHKKRIERLYSSSGDAIFGAEESATSEPDDLPESLDVDLNDFGDDTPIVETRDEPEEELTVDESEDLTLEEKSPDTPPEEQKEEVEAKEQVEQEEEEEEEAEKIDPHVERILVEVDVFLRYGLTIKAKERLEEAKRIDKYEPAIYEKLAGVHTEEKDSARAIENLAEAAACWQRREKPAKAEALHERIAALQAEAPAKKEEPEPSRVEDLTLDEGMIVETGQPEVQEEETPEVIEEPAPVEMPDSPVADDESSSELDFLDEEDETEEAEETEAPPAIDPLAARISEAEYYLEQNFTSAANHLLSMLRDQYPDDQRVETLWKQLEEQTEASLDENEVEKELDDFFSPLEDSPEAMAESIQDSAPVEEISHEEFVEAVKAEMAAEKKLDQDDEVEEEPLPTEEEMLLDVVIEGEEEEEEIEEFSVTPEIPEEPAIEEIAEEPESPAPVIEEKAEEEPALTDLSATLEEEEEEEIAEEEPAIVESVEAPEEVLVEPDDDIADPFSATPEVAAPMDDSPLRDIADILEDDLFAVHSAAEKRLSQMNQPGRLITAERILSHIQEVPMGPSPANAEKHFEMGLAYMETGLYEEAINEFQTAAEDSVFFQRSCLQLGICFLSKGMHSTAVEWLQRGIGGGGDETIMADSLHQLAIIYQIQGQKEAFRHSVEQLESLDDQHPGLATLKAIL